MTSIPRPSPIPRPKHFESGAPAPWSSLSPDLKVGLELEVVLGALRQEGFAAPFDSLTAQDSGDAVAAVLVALFEEDGETRVLLTRRSPELRSHTGQVSFPGGRVDPGEDPPKAALREAAEEVGLDPGIVSIAGELRPMFVLNRAVLSNTPLIVSVIGSIEGRPHLKRNPSEVARIFDVALSDLLADGAFHEERWPFPSPRDPPPGDGLTPVWFFDVAGETVWGVTARILVELLTMLLGLPRPVIPWP